MKLSHKVAKLFDPDILASAGAHLRRTLHPISSRKLLQELEANNSWNDLRARFPRREKEVHRFADIRFWIKRNVERAQDLSLDRGPHLEILDLGCGPGFFLYVAKKLGHNALGLDLDEQPIFRETVRLLEVNRTVHRIAPCQPLPATGQKFDLITSYLTCFHRKKKSPDGNWEMWSPAEWQFFIDDVRAHYLAPGGTLLLEFHPQRDGRLYSAELRQTFRENRARIFRSHVFLSHLPV